MNYIKILKLLVIVALVSFTHFSTYSQANSNCANATPFCTGTSMVFPAGVNAGTAQQGPCYGCLGSEPNPAWFFLQMSTAGPVSIAMSAANDIDFICWGPFPSLAGVCGQLCGNIQSCSYSSSNTETCTIANAVAGSFYVMLITNFSNSNQTITFAQTNSGNSNAGTTNCGVICGITLSNSGVICSGQSNTLTATTGTSINSYAINGPGGVVASGSLPSANNTFTNVVSNILTTTAYTLVATNNSGTCSAVSTVSVLQYPTFSITPNNPTICQGGQFTAGVAFTGTNTQGPYTYNWSGNLVTGSFSNPVPGIGIFSPGNQNTQVSPSQIVGTQATILYQVTVSTSTISCPVTHTMLLTINNPLTPTLSLPAPLCSTTTPVLLTATPGGGTWSAHSGVAPNGLFTPGNATSYIDTVMYTVNAGTCSVSKTGTISISHFNPSSLTSSISALCSHGDVPVDLMTIVTSTANGVWSGTSVNNNQFNPGGLATGIYNLVYNTTSSPIASVCPSHNTIPVAVFNPPTPVIVPVSPLCNNHIPVQLVATPTVEGVWSAQGVAALTGVLSPTAYPTGGPQTILYTSGHGTCAASSSIIVQISEFRTAALTGTVPNLCVTNNPFDLQSISVVTSGSWSGNSNVVNNFFDPAHPYPLPTGLYVLNHHSPSFPDATLCADDQTITVSVLNPPTPNITLVGPYCNVGAPVQLTVTPAIGSWVVSSYVNANGVFTPSLSPVGNNIVQYVIGTNTCSSQETVSISVEGFVPASITNSISDQCTTNPPVNLLPITVSNLGTWSGVGVLGTSFDPALSGTGTITLTYNTASSPSGLCPDQATVAVSVYSLATPVFVNVNSLCNSSAPLKLSVSPVGGIFGGVNNGAIDRDGIFNPASGIIGGNIVNYSITSGPCIAYSQTTLNIEKFISADFISAAGPYCKNDPLRARNLNELVLNPGGTWGGQGMTGSLFTFANANIGDNNIISYQTHSLPTATLCPDTSVIRIKVYDTPNVLALSSKNQGCAPVEIDLNTPSVNTGAGSWDFGDGSVHEAGLSLKHTYTTPGTYTVIFTYSLMVAADFACVAQAVIPTPIRVFDMPKPDFTYSPDEILISNPTVQFNNVSASVERNRYQWTITGADLNETLQEVDPSVDFPHAGDYKVTLSATNLNGCKNEVSKVLTVKTEFNIYVPSSFSPNEDGINDYFFPVFSEYGLDEKTFEMQIFDRWGNLLFQTKDRSQKWDGKKSGSAVKQDVYVYKIKYKDVSGTVYNKTGFVTLIK